jgi:ribulose kinase
MIGEYKDEKKVRDIPSKIIKAVKKTLEDPDVTDARVKGASAAAYVLFGWVNAILGTNGALLIV